MTYLDLGDIFGREIFVYLLETVYSILQIIYIRSVSFQIRSIVINGRMFSLFQYYTLYLNNKTKFDFYGEKNPNVLFKKKKLIKNYLNAESVAFIKVAQNSARLKQHFLPAMLLLFNYSRLFMYVTFSFFFQRNIFSV